MYLHHQFLHLQRLLNLGLNSNRVTNALPPVITTADNTHHTVQRCFFVPVQFDGMFAIIEILSAPTLSMDITLGIPFMFQFQVGIFTPNSTWTPPEDTDQIDELKIAELKDTKEIEIDPDFKETGVESRRNLTPQQSDLLAIVEEKFAKLGKILLGRTNVISHDIDTGDNTPSFTRTRPRSPAIEIKVEQEFLRFKEMGVIEPAETAFRNALTMVERYKQGKLKLRLCLDSRKLNSITKIENYDIPRITTITTILSRFGRAKYMSKVDLKDAYTYKSLSQKDLTKKQHFSYGDMEYGNS